MLIIDDDPDLLYITGLALSEEDDFTITLCSSPTDALNHIQSQKFDAIICDYYMPGMDGCSLMALMRSYGSSALHILYSGKALDGNRVEPIQADVDVYVQRQGTPAAEYRELVQIIRNAFTVNKQQPDG